MAQYDLTKGTAKRDNDRQGGLKKIYLTEYVDYSRSQVVLTGQLITSIPTATIYEYDQRIKFLSTLNDVAGLLAQERDLHLYVTETNTGGQGIDYNELLSLKIRVEKLFKTKAIEAIANKWGSVPGKATAMYYLKYEKEYARIMPFDKFKKDNNLTGVKNKKPQVKHIKRLKVKVSHK